MKLDGGRTFPEGDAGSGEVFAAPIDVQLSEHDIVQPDLVVVLPPRQRQITRAKINGAPDLLIEVLSPATRVHDRQCKKRLYECSGVCEYWIVDPGEHTIEQYRLGDSGYELVTVERDAVTLRVLPAVTIDLTTVW